MRLGVRDDDRAFAVEEEILLVGPSDAPMTHALVRIMRARGLDPILEPTPARTKIAPTPVLIHAGRRVGGFDAIIAHLDVIAPRPLGTEHGARAAVEGWAAGWLEDAGEALVAVAERKRGAALAARVDLWRALAAAVSGGRWLGEEQPSAADIAWGTVVECLPRGTRLPTAIREWVARLRAHGLVALRRRPPRSALMRFLFKN